MELNLTQQVIEALGDNQLTGDEIMKEVGGDWTLLSKILQDLEEKGKVVKTESGLLNDPWVWELTHLGALDLPQKVNKKDFDFQEPGTTSEVNPPPNNDQTEKTAPQIDLTPSGPIEPSEEISMGANPQKEDGFIPIANEIGEVLAKINLSPYESRILWVIFRKTYGWHKKTDQISITQFQEITGLKRRHIQRALSNLIQRNIVTSKGYSKIITYGFQKDYTKWKNVTSKGYEPLQKINPSPHKKDGSAPKEVTMDGSYPKEVTDRNLKRCPQKKLTKEKIYVEDSAEFRLATLLLEEIRKNKPDYRQPNLQAWAREIDLMIRRDGRDPERIRQVIEWCQSDSFWWKNILSASKLKEKFERLEAEMEEKKGKEPIKQRGEVEYKDLTGGKG